MPHFKTIAEFEAEHGLTVPEKRLIEACRAGEQCVLADTRPEVATQADIIRADLLRLLIIGGGTDGGFADSGVWLHGGWITGPLDLDFATAHGMTTLDACTFTDPPQMMQAHLRHLSLDDSHLPGLMAQGMVVEGSVLLRRLIATGMVNLAGAQITGQLDCSGAKLNGQTGLESWGTALNAQAVKVGADLFLCTVTATGTVNLAGAQITGQLDCSGATFNGQTGPQSWGTALNAQGAKVGASLFLRTVTATGTVNLNGAQTEQLDCMEASFDGKSGWALNAQRLVVKQIFFWRKIQQIRGRVYLASAQVGDLADDLASWPADLYLDGFTYDRISAAPTDAKQRLGWLSNGSTINGTFSPQPYTQLAKVLFAMGHDRDARKVLMEREKRLAVEARRTRRRKSDGVVLLPFESPWEDAAYVATWLWDALTRWIVGYGFAPIRSFYWMIALLALTTALAQATWSEGSFAPNSDVILTSPSWTDIAALDCKGPLPAKLPDGFTTCDKNPAETWSDNPDRGLDWTSFNSGAYAADLVIPVLDLGQTSAWAPSKDRSRMGWIFWWASWWLEGLGWFITALGAAAITGLIQRDRE